MADVAELIRALDELLDPGRLRRHVPERAPGAGRGADRARRHGRDRPARAVRARACEEQAQLVLVHHGLFWDFAPVGLTPRLAERLRPLLPPRHRARRLPPAARRAPGGRQQRAARGGARRGRARGVRRDRPWRHVRRAAARGRAVRARGRRRPAASRSCSTPAARRCAGWRSSRAAAASRLDQAVAEGYDAFLTGEPKENVMADAREAGIHFIAAGHYATETFGVRRLGDWLARPFRRRHTLGRHPESGLSRMFSCD